MNQPQFLGFLAHGDGVAGGAGEVVLPITGDLENLQNPADAGELFVRFELAVLNDLGFGLDLTECAATGVREDLAFVSPKSGRAVCRAAGLPWADKMLALPPFLTSGAMVAADGDSLSAAFRLTGFFLHRHVYEPRGIQVAAARDGFIQAAMKAVVMISRGNDAVPSDVAAGR